MDVKGLKLLLDKYPDDMQVIFCCHSDYSPMDPDYISTVKAVDKGHYVLRTHPTMSAENKAAVKTMLCFPGN